VSSKCQDFFEAMLYKVHKGLCKTEGAPKKS